MHMYLVWRVANDLNGKIALHLMIAGNTKNDVDGVFSHIKRRLKATEVRTSKQMMEDVEGNNVQT